MEGRVFGNHFAERDPHLLVTGLVLGRNGDGDNRIREYHGLERGRLVRVAQGMAGLDVLHAQYGNDVSGLRGVKFLTVVGMHFHDTSNAFGFAGSSVQHGGAFFQLAGIDTQEGQGSVAVIHDFESQGSQGPFRIDDSEFAGFVALEINLRLWFDFGRVRQEVNNGIQYELNTLVLERRTAIGREEIHLDGALADQALQGVHIRLLTLEVLFHDLVVLFDHLFHHFGTPGFDIIRHVRGYVFDLVLHGIARVIPDPGLACEEVDHADKIVFAANGQGHDQRMSSQYVLDLLDDAIKIGAEAIQFVDVDDAGDFGIIRIAPVGFGLGFHTAGTTENANATIQNLQGAVNLDREINVPGGVDDVEAVVVPEAGCSG